jgi:hypothetical protein
MTIHTTQTEWRSPCGRARIENRNGLLWCYIDADHVGTQLLIEAAIKLVMRKLGETE